MSTSPSSQLCLRCGLCCEGALFDHAALTEKEFTALRDTRVSLFTDADGQRMIRFRCGALDGACCTVYGKRPSICRTFKCALLRELEAGEVTLAEATAVVEETLALKKELNLQSSDGPMLKQVLAMTLPRGSRNKDARSTSLARLAELIALRFLPDDA